jgi:hypothetical protein
MITIRFSGRLLAAHIQYFANFGPELNTGRIQKEAEPGDQVQNPPFKPDRADRLKAAQPTLIALFTRKNR